MYEEFELGILEREGGVIAARPGFEDACALAGDRAWAEENGVSTISGLAPYAPEMVDPEFATREDGLPQIKRVYGFTFNSKSSLTGSSQSGWKRSRKNTGTVSP